jgi:hypothetical protein
MNKISTDSSDQPNLASFGYSDFTPSANASASPAPLVAARASAVVEVAVAAAAAAAAAVSLATKSLRSTTWFASHLPYGRPIAASILSSVSW